MPDAPTLIAGRYRLGDQLGHGGMGRVWRARDEILERDVAIKEIDVPPDLAGANREAVQRRTLREARAAARLNHPGVVQVYDVLELDGRTWIVMEYVPSRTLQEVLKADGPLEPRRVAKIGLDLLMALRAANAAGVDHRDVKPANVLIADDGRVMLTDFGIATIEGDSLITSGFDTLIGSPGYLSPERAGHGTAGLTSDLWSLGATLYCAVEGHAPFQRASTVATLTALATVDPDPPRLAGVLRPVLDGLLRKNPDERAGPDETEDLLRTALTGSYGRAVVHPDPVPEQAAPGKREHIPAQRSPSDPLEPGTVPTNPPQPVNRRRLIIGAVVLVVMLGAVVWFTVRTTSNSTAHSTTTTATVTVASAVPTASSTTPSSAATRSASPPSVAPATTKPATTKPATTKPATTPVAARPARPAGWHNYRDKTGFSVYVPDGWTRSQEGTIVYFRGAGRVLGIDQSEHPRSNPVADWRGQRDYRVSRGDFPNYHQLRLAAVPYFRKAADWEFTFTKGNRRHVNNRGFVVSSSQAYGIYWQTSDADWSAAHPDLALIFASFRPAAT